MCCDRDHMLNSGSQQLPACDVPLPCCSRVGDRYIPRNFANILFNTDGPGTGGSHEHGGKGDNSMHRRLTGIVMAALLASPLQAADRITAEQIQQVIDTTDAAAMNRDTAGIGAYLGDDFEKIIEFPHDKWMAKVRINKEEYLALIDAGWTTIEEYDYQRADTEIHVMPDGLSGLSYSTVTENLVQDGKQMTSKFREYATYELEDGRPVITKVSGHTLVGDTTPY